MSINHSINIQQVQQFYQHNRQHFTALQQKQQQL